MPRSSGSFSAKTGNVIAAIAYRDLLKFLRDRTRMIGTFLFPIIMVGALGGSLQAAFGRSSDINLLAFTFTGVFAQMLFQTTAFGLISIIEDRQHDFMQEIFVSPISRYSIVMGKIVGETLVALPQALVLVVFGAAIGVGLQFEDFGNGLDVCEQVVDSLARPR